MRLRGGAKLAGSPAPSGRSCFLALLPAAGGLPRSNRGGACTVPFQLTSTRARSAGYLSPAAAWGAVTGGGVTTARNGMCCRAGEGCDISRTGQLSLPRSVPARDSTILGRQTGPESRCYVATPIVSAGERLFLERGDPSRAAGTVSRVMRQARLFLKRARISQRDSRTAVPSKATTSASRPSASITAAASYHDGRLLEVGWTVTTPPGNERLNAAVETFRPSCRSPVRASGWVCPGSTETTRRLRGRPAQDDSTALQASCRRCASRSGVA